MSSSPPLSRPVPLAPSAPLIADTLVKLAAVRRLAPVGLVCALAIAVEAAYTPYPLSVLVVCLMAAVFPVAAPLLWRALTARSALPGWAGIAAYAVLGAAVVVVCAAGVPRALGLGPTLLTDPIGVAASTVLFWLGGWSLGRDMELEETLGAEREARFLARREASHAQLLALQAHLDPHFLFNTLNAIAEWCRDDPGVAERATLRLSAMLRAVLDGIEQPLWPLERELDLVDALFELYAVRDPDRLQVDRNVAPEALAAAVPPMLLVAIAENAIKHGPWAGNPGVIALTIAAEDGWVRVALENPGSYAGPRPGGAGLDIVTRRLEAVYGGAARFHIADVGGRTRAELGVPREPGGGGGGRG